MSRLALREVEGGTELKLRVRAGASKTAITGIHDGTLKLTVTTAPEKGKANRTVLQLLARHLDLSPTALSLTSGETSPNKTILVPLPKETVNKRLTR